MKILTPDRGDIVWVDFSPRRGREQSGLRPALIISPIFYNKRAGLALACPITSKVKKYDYEVLISEGEVKGAILCDQIRAIDLEERINKFSGKASAEIISLVQEKIKTLIFDY